MWAYTRNEIRNTASAATQHSRASPARPPVLFGRWRRSFRSTASTAAPTRSRSSSSTSTSSAGSPAHHRSLSSGNSSASRRQGIRWDDGWSLEPRHSRESLDQRLRRIGSPSPGDVDGERSSQTRRRRNAVSYTEPPWLDEAQERSDTQDLLARIVAEQGGSTGQPSNEDVVELLPRRVISLTTSESLAAVDDSCAICLEGYAEGEELVCLPCDGLHKGHWRCLRRWLQGAHTCPQCRWSLPRSASSGDLPALMSLGESELERLRALPSGKSKRCTSSESSRESSLAPPSSSSSTSSAATSLSSRGPPRCAECGKIVRERLTRVSDTWCSCDGI